MVVVLVVACANIESDFLKHNRLPRTYATQQWDDDGNESETGDYDLVGCYGDIADTREPPLRVLHESGVC